MSFVTYEPTLRVNPPIYLLAYFLDELLWFRRRQDEVIECLDTAGHRDPRLDQKAHHLLLRVEMKSDA